MWLKMYLNGVYLDKTEVDFTELDTQFKALPINERIVESSEAAERNKDRQAMKDYLKNKK